MSSPGLGRSMDREVDDSGRWGEASTSPEDQEVEGEAEKKGVDAVGDVRARLQHLRSMGEGIREDILSLERALLVMEGRS